MNTGLDRLRALIVVVLLLTTGAAVGQDPVVLPAAGEVVRVQERALVRSGEDIERLEDARAADGYSPWRSDVSGKAWLKIPIEAPDFASGPWRIEIKRRFFRTLEVYVPQVDGSVQRYSNGLDEYHPVTISAQSMVYTLNLRPGQRAELLLRVDTIQGSLGPLDLSIRHERQFLADRAEAMWAFGLYFGAVLALVFYNLVLYLNLRTPGHRMYVLAMTTVLLFMGMDSGLLQSWLPEVLREREHLISVLLNCLMMAATIRFFQVFTSSSAWIPRMDRLLAWASVAFLVVAAVAAFAPLQWAAQLAPLSQLLSTLMVFLLISASVLAGRRGSGAAWVFLAAWSAFLLGGFSRSFVSFDLVERSALFEYAVYVGSVMEALILALGLSHRVGQLREKRIRAEHEQQRAMTLANQDALTGVYNRRFFENYLDTVLDDSGRVESEGALILLDIDHFKDINDTHGHEAGDMMLRSLARRCLRELREGDALCRLGGDEFAIVLRTSSGESALDVARRLHTTVTERPVHYEQTMIKLSISVGVLDRFQASEDRSSALRRVDQALYRAKEGGRNRVESTAPDDPAAHNGSSRP